MAFRVLLRATLWSLPLLCGAALAQSAPAVETAPVNRTPRIERLVVEDSALVIEELRYGGQTQSVVVHPKGGMPAYEFQPGDFARSRPGDARDGLAASGGQRVWNLFKF